MQKGKMDSDTTAVLLNLCELCRGILKSASETHLLALRMHDALLNAQVPGYFQAYEAAEVSFKELDAMKCELKELTDNAVRELREKLPPR